jgi:hypothetical protein
MKKMLIAASAVGTVIAGLIFYVGKRSGRQAAGKLKSSGNQLNGSNQITVRENLQHAMG